MSFTDAQIAGFKATLEKEHAREFSKAEALDALVRLTEFIKAVSNIEPSSSDASGHGDFGDLNT